MKAITIYFKNGYIVMYFLTFQALCLRNTPYNISLKKGLVSYSEISQKCLWPTRNKILALKIVTNEKYSLMSELSQVNQYRI